LDQSGQKQHYIQSRALVTDQAIVDAIVNLNPKTVLDLGAARAGWREESWQSIGDDFSGNAPWHYRSLPAWRKLFTDCALQVTDEIVPIHPLTNEPASIIFVLRKTN
jgi:hypothetical protein